MANQTFSTLFDFATTAQSFVSTAGNTKITLAYDSTTGNPAGALKSSCTTKNTAAIGSYWEWTGTWEQLGVPTNSTIISIQLTGANYRCSAFTAGTGCKSGPYELRDDAGNLLTTFWAGVSQTASSSTWSTVPASSTYNVASGQAPSTATIKIRLNNTIGTTNTTGASITLYDDQIALTVIYNQDRQGTSTLSCTHATISSSSITGNRFGSLASTTTHPLISSSASQIVPIYHGSSAVSANHTTFTASGSARLATFTGNATLTANHSTFASSSSFTAPSFITPLVGHWAFDDPDGTVVADSSGNNNDGTCPTGMTHVTGQLGTALAFNGTSDYVKVSNPPALTGFGTALSLAVWFNTTLNSTYQLLIGKMSVDGATIEYALILPPDQTSIYWALSGITTGTITPISTSWQLNSWHHLAMTYDGAHVVFYLDGNVVANIAESAAIQSTTLDLYFGGTSTGNRAFTGNLDELRIYNTTLSATDVVNLVALNVYTGYAHIKCNNASLTVNDPKWVGYWTFDEGSITDIPNHTSYPQYNLGLVGTPVLSTNVPSVIGKGYSLQLDGTQYVGGNVMADAFNQDEASVLDVTHSIWFYFIGSSGILLNEYDAVGSFHCTNIEVGADGTVEIGVWPRTVTINLGIANLNAWNHVILRYNSVNQQFDGFLNGVQGTPGFFGRVSSVSYGGPNYLFMGPGNSQNMGVAGGYLPGNIDEINLFCRPLSDSECAKLYQAKSIYLQGSYTTPVFVGSATVNVTINHPTLTATTGSFVVPVYHGNATLSKKPTFTSTGTRTVPVYSATLSVSTTHSILIASSHFVIPTYTGNATLSKSATFVSTAKNTIPVYTGNASLSKRTTFTSAASNVVPVYHATLSVTTTHTTFSGGAKNTVPVFTATVSVITSHAVISASSVYASIYTGNSTLNKSVTFIGTAKNTVPVYNGTSSVTTTHSIVGATGVRLIPTYIGNSTLSKSATFTSAASAVIPIYHGTSSVMATHSTVNATGIRLIPTYMGNSTLSSRNVTFTSSGTVIIPVYSGTAGLTTGHPTVSTGVGIFSPPGTFGAVSSLSKHATFTANSTATIPVYRGTSGLTINHTTISTGLGSFAPLVFNGNALNLSKSVTIVSSGVVTIPVYSGTLSRVVNAFIFSGSGGAPSPGIFTSHATLSKQVTFIASGHSFVSIFTGTAVLQVTHSVLMASGQRKFNPLPGISINRGFKDMILIKLNEITGARRRVPFDLVSSSDNISGLTGQTVPLSAIQVYNNGGGEATATGIIGEIGGGLYYYEFASGEVAVLGQVTVRVNYTGAVPFKAVAQIVAFDPYDATRYGLSSLPNANANTIGGLITFGTGAGQLNVDGTGGSYIALGQNVPVIDVTGKTTQNVGDCLSIARAEGAGKWTFGGTTETIFGPDGVQVVRVFTLNDPIQPTQRS